MRSERLLLVLIAVLCVVAIPSIVRAATITSCTWNKAIYHQGDTGYISVTIYNDQDATIRVTELTATIEYYYVDATIYVQKFFTNAELPTEIEPGGSDSFTVPFSLPTNIASGYTDVAVRAKTEVWVSPVQRWFTSEFPSSQLTLYIESPYVQRYEGQVAMNDQLEEQLEEQLAANENVTNLMYLFGVTTLVFAGVAAFLYYVLSRRMRFVSQPVV